MHKLNLKVAASYKVMVQSRLLYRFWLVVKYCHLAFTG